jgi:hypothetical protein
VPATKACPTHHEQLSSRHVVASSQLFTNGILALHFADV